MNTINYTEASWTGALLRDPSYSTFSAYADYLEEGNNIRKARRVRYAIAMCRKYNYQLSNWVGFAVYNGPNDDYFKNST
jgi:hypothetical protein